jgi:hypothetical protein
LLCADMLQVEISKGGRRDRDDYSRGGGGRDYGGDRFRCGRPAAANASQGLVSQPYYRH